MKQKVLVNDRDVPLDTAQSATVREIEPGVYSVLWNGRAFEARIWAQGGSYCVDLEGFRLTAEVRNPRDYATRSKESPGAGRQEVIASMPGKVIRVLVTVGQKVEPGQGLIVIEAMKMQNEMKASKLGRTTKVHVQDGETIAAGDVLITIE